MKVLVLGVNGMLGSMVFDYLSRFSSNEVIGTFYEDGSTTVTSLYKDSLIKMGITDYPDFHILKDLLQKTHPDYIVNCIGIIKQSLNVESSGSYRFNAIMLNAALPAFLSKTCSDILPNCKILQIATDCVFKGNKGWYNENDENDETDIYGMTKSLGEYQAENFVNIRCSIIGPELFRHKSLMDWAYFNNDNVIHGYLDHLWNGVTTLQFAELTNNIIEKEITIFFEPMKTFHYVPNETVSKYQLLKIIDEEFTLQKSIIPVYSPHPINRTIIPNTNKIDTQPMRLAIHKLHLYIREASIYQKHRDILANL